MLDAEAVELYSRQIILPEVGARGQTRLRQAAVLVCGDGAAASGTALFLIRSGVGQVTRATGDACQTSPIESIAMPAAVTDLLALARRYDVTVLLPPFATTAFAAAVESVYIPVLLGAAAGSRMCIRAGGDLAVPAADQAQAATVNTTAEVLAAELALAVLRLLLMPAARQWRGADHHLLAGMFRASTH